MTTHVLSGLNFDYSNHKSDWKIFFNSDTSGSSEISEYGHLDEKIAESDELKKIEEFNKALEIINNSKNSQVLRQITKHDSESTHIIKQIEKINKELTEKEVNRLYNIICSLQTLDHDKIKQATKYYISRIEKDILFDVLTKVEEKLGLSGYWFHYGQKKAIQVIIDDYTGFLRNGGLVYKISDLDKYPYNFKHTAFEVITIGLFTMSVIKRV